MQGLDIYDAAGRPVTDYQPDMGWLEKQTRVHHHAAVEAVAEQGHWEVTAEYPETGGRDVQWVIDVPGVEGREAWDEEEEYFLFVPFTEAEQAQIAADRQRPTAEERVAELEEALELLLSGATDMAEVTADEGGVAGADTGL